ncbi:restriction endonuclease subunit R [Solemya pervernicosa gill symbiont]|uniref:Restriction endonuclease subunit R n=1 Tax=Solemya pervernicosa gill symbiont TaxID=642797 RepID=A0A1T2L2X5_9GAMM|nr:DEAD/DEAH box helicase family protein [Solemya pervernicosa gill symbiont]OOZ39370.1 restriction endonuclease subunit R [Solemya pervernicosa gill symbiont]
MAAFTPKNYQSAVLESVEHYFRNCRTMGNANTAFYQTTLELWNRGSQYSPIDGFAVDMPYFCLRVPTGGGKTWLAAKSVAQINTHLLGLEHSVILWLVPSNAIREQTLRALKDRFHPYHQALCEAGPVTVLDLDDAKSVNRATLDTSTTIIVTTRQAFQVDDTEIRKVYESSGALMHHFDNLHPEQRAHLEQEDGVVPYSLANVLRLRRPFVIVDEAHNSRTDLSFETLSRFNPSGIMELTATPDTEKHPSNVLHSVYAAELKGEEMIKLPIRLESEPDWQQCLADAIARREELQNIAESERRQGAAYLRPIVLIQAEKHYKNRETLDVERVRTELIENHRIPESEVVVATGGEKGLEKINAEYEQGILSEQCPVKFVITQQALAEGWDCPFAYVLVSMAEVHSSTAVEQLLGRILRQPGAKHRSHEALNRSYAFVVSRDFNATAEGLRDRLVQGAGFDRMEAAAFVSAAKPEQGVFDYKNRLHRAKLRPVVVELKEKPELKKIPKATRDKLKWDAKSSTLTISEPLSEEEAEEVKATVVEDISVTAIETAAVESRTTAVEFFQTPAELGVSFEVPELALRFQGELELFEDPEQLDYLWELSPYDAHPNRDELARLDLMGRVAGGGDLDIDEDVGKMKLNFIADLQRDLGLVYTPEHWDEAKLATWFCRNLHEPTLSHDSKRAFVAAWMSHVMEKPNMDLAKLNQRKFEICNLLDARIRSMRKQAANSVYQEMLFTEGADERVSVSDEFVFTFNPYAYAPSRDNADQYEPYDFRHHYYSRIGDFDSKEEFECAVWLDQQADKGRIEFWVRNLVRREGSSFSLQKSDGKFYPDFVCKLPDGTVLIVEYKGGDKWDVPKVKMDRLVGELWANMSDGRCRFVMTKDREWSTIDALL